jgi:hypothetical protein
MKLVNIVIADADTLANRKMRSRLADLRLIASRTVSRSELQRRNSCVSDARDYRVASSARRAYAHV